MLTQNLLPFKLEIEKSKSGLTALGGLPVWFELLVATDLMRAVARFLKIRRSEQGFNDNMILSCLILLQLAGGESVDDVDILRKDEGFVALFRYLSLSILKRKERRRLQRKRDGNLLAVPSPSVIRRWLLRFQDEDSQSHRPASGAWIPKANLFLRAMQRINAVIVAFMQKHHGRKVATLDMDATLIETSKKSALFGYKGFKAYQPLNVWWAEQEMMVHTEFRDGNVPAGFEQKRILQEALKLLPSGVGEIRLRSDSAGYQWDLMRYCQKGWKDKKICFSISCDVSKAFKDAVREVDEADWHPVWDYHKHGAKKTWQQWAEVPFVPNKLARGKTQQCWRYIAVREPMQNELPGTPEPETSFPTCKMQRGRYKLQGIVTNIPHVECEPNNGRSRGCSGKFNRNGMWGENLVHWHRERCGKSEQAHSLLKSDLAGGKMPSNTFGANAAWWWIAVMSMNIHTIMTNRVLGGEWAGRRLKVIRFRLIHLAARVLKRGRQYYIRYSKKCDGIYRLLLESREKIMEMMNSPG